MLLDLKYQTIITIIFIIGYLGIIFEDNSKIHKTATALIVAVLCWTSYFLLSGTPLQESLFSLEHHLASMSQIVFFLIGAMTIVEVIDAHQGFQFISKIIHSQSKRRLLWMIGFITFFMSSVLDNLTTTIAMLSLMKKLLKNQSDRWLFGSIIVIAANSGGAWTPIGDITTTMLWINGNLTTLNVIKTLFFPCLVSLATSLFLYQHLFLQNDREEFIQKDPRPKKEKNSLLIFLMGSLLLASVPLFKSLTHLPPYMGMLISLGILWLFTDLLYHKKSHLEHLRVSSAFKKIDLASILFFAGLLLSVSALETANILGYLATLINDHIANETIVATFIGLFSAIIDNVPLVAACMSMYDLQTYPIDSMFWLLIAYCSGTGGSILIIGSSSGIALMGMEKVDFFWYLKKISFCAALGYFAGIISYLLINQFSL